MDEAYDIDKVRKEFLRITGASKRVVIEAYGDTAIFKVPLSERASVTSRWWKGNQEKFYKSIGVKAGEDWVPGIQIKTIIPELVTAKLGDFVIVFDDYTDNPEEFDVGIVTSARIIGGKACYGCRHIGPRDMGTLGDCFLDGVFEITKDDYGGLPVGFYKVIDRQTAIRMAAKKIRASVQEAINDLSKQLSNIEEQIGSALDKFKYRSSVELLSSDDREPTTYDET